jgi:hypothetical protein
MKEEKHNIETVAQADLYNISGGSTFESAFGVMVGLAFIAGATGLALPLAGAVEIGAILTVAS